MRSSLLIEDKPGPALLDGEVNHLDRPLYADRRQLFQLQVRGVRRYFFASIRTIIDPELPRLVELRCIEAAGDYTTAQLLRCRPVVRIGERLVVPQPVAALFEQVVDDWIFEGNQEGLVAGHCHGGDHLAEQGPYRVRAVFELGHSIR